MKNKPAKPKKDYVTTIEKYLNTNYKGLPKNATMLDLVKYFNFHEEYKKEFLERKKIVPDLANMIDSDIEAIERKYKEIALKYKNKEANSANDWLKLTAHAIISNGQNFPIHVFFSTYLKTTKIDAIVLEDSYIKAIAEGASDAYCLKFLKDELQKVDNKESKTLHTIQWNGKNKNDLIYLLWKMEKEDLISINSFGKDLSEIFADETGKPIGNTLFNKYKSEFEKLKFPVNANEIDKLISILKKKVSNKKV